MRLLALVMIAGSVACTRMNPSYGDGGTDGAGTANVEDDDSDPSADTITDASVSDAEASADEVSSAETGVEDSAGETGTTRSCCTRHVDQGCEHREIESCVCEGIPKCCEIEWTDECVEKARFSCGAECEVVDDGAVETTDTTVEEGTSDSFGTSGTSSTTTSGEEAGSTGPAVNACCLPQDGAGCGDKAVENCVCVTQGLESCCSDAWEEQCGLAVIECDVACA